MRIVAFAGPKGSGKDTAAKYLLARNSLLKANLFGQQNFADPMKLACSLCFGLTQAEMYDPPLKEVMLDRWPYKCPRDLMQSFANLMRTMYAPDIWVKAWERRVRLVNPGCIVVTDLRFQEEYDVLKALGAKIVYVHNPRVEAIRAEGILNNDPLWCDSSEALAPFLRKVADAELQNDGASLDILHTQVHEVMLTVLPDWNEWQELTSIDGGLRI